MLIFITRYNFQDLLKDSKLHKRDFYSKVNFYSKVQ